jgi:anti-sigma regulatory factor (Ser/Thr protein kinase)
MEHLNRPITVRIPNDLGYLGGLLALTRETSAKCGFEEHDISMIEVAVEEAVTNVVRHSFSREEEEFFEVTLEPFKLGLEVRICDKGRPLDPRNVERYDPAELKQSGNPQGLGSFLIKRLMDTVEYRALGNQGKMVRMVKYLREPAGFSGESGPVAPVLLPEPEQVLPPIDFEIRRLKPEDAFSVAELAYDTYGYSYLYEHIYFPDRVTALNASNELISVVAVTKDMELAGHVGMVCDPGLPGLGELGLAMVKPKFRGYKLLEKVSQQCVGAAQDLGINGIFAQATTIHTYSQPVPKKAGMKPVGFILGYISPMNLKSIEESAKDRVTPVVSFKLLRPFNAGALFIPARHKPIVEKLLHDVSVAWEQASSDPAVKDHSVYSVTVNPVSLLAKVIVYETGRDIVHELKRILVRVREESLLIGELMLNLCEPLTASLYDEIESLGLVFTGLLPASSRGTFITLVYLNGINVRFDNIKLIEDNGQDLLAYIRLDYEKRFLE